MEEQDEQDEHEIRENIEKQLMEIEILQSIYSNSNELQLEDQEALDDLKRFALQSTPVNKYVVRRKLGFVIKFAVDCEKEPLLLEITCRFPSSYPLKSPPEVFTRCVNKNLAREFPEELKNYIYASHDFDSSILNIIEWIKENLGRFANDCKSQPLLPPARLNTKFSRIFIYSHHIYSVKKRSCIVDWTRELSLDGFCMPGKPGCVCVEGDNDSVQEFMTRMRSVPWQKIQIKDTYTVELSSGGGACKEEMKSLKKFDSFEEKLFLGSSDTSIDLGLLFAFLKERGLEHVFSLYFGVDGKLPASTA